MTDYYLVACLDSDDATNEMKKMEKKLSDAGLRSSRKLLGYSVNESCRRITLNDREIWFRTASQLMFTGVVFKGINISHQFKRCASFESLAIVDMHRRNTETMFSKGENDELSKELSK